MVQTYEYSTFALKTHDSSTFVWKDAICVGLEYLFGTEITYPENVPSKILKSGHGGIKLRASDQKKSTLIEINVIPSNVSNLSPNNIKNKIANLNHQHCIYSFIFNG